MGMGVTSSPLPVHWVPTPSGPLAWGALPIEQGVLESSFHAVGQCLFLLLFISSPRESQPRQRPREHSPPYRPPSRTGPTREEEKPASQTDSSNQQISPGSRSSNALPRFLYANSGTKSLSGERPRPGALRGLGRWDPSATSAQAQTGTGELVTPMPMA